MNSSRRVSMDYLPTLGSVRAAVSFLTRVPVGRRPLHPQDLRNAPALFPLVGGALGLLAACVFTLAAPLSPLAAAVLCVSFTAYLTGAFHEDGLADTADALGGDVSRERALEILKDSRIGSFGTVALVLTLLARVMLLSQIQAPAVLPLVACHCLARLAPVWLMTHLPHASPDGSKSKDLLSLDRRSAYVALVLAAMALAPAWWLERASLLRLGVAVGVVLLIGLWFAVLSKRRLGGITGDVLGATEQLCEVGVLAVFAWAAHSIL
ncbi:MAG: adenosylcobinamide-GDP ribazoletransferase [Myxococcota bacterium]|nr:adenosylcobinamide-GDP ribazoletransferase [Myxococcota bacterium]